MIDVHCFKDPPLQLGILLHHFLIVVEVFGKSLTVYLWEILAQIS